MNATALVQIPSKTETVPRTWTMIQEGCKCHDLSTARAREEHPKVTTLGAGRGAVALGMSEETCNKDFVWKPNAEIKKHQTSSY